MDVSQLLPLAACFFSWLVGGLIGLVSGVGSGLVSLPVLVACFGAKGAIPVSIAAGLYFICAMTWRFRRYLVLRDLVAPALWMLPGGLAGLALFYALPGWLLTAAIGALLIVSAYVAARSLSTRTGKAPGRLVTAVLGMMAGLTQNALSVGGPWMGILIAVQGWDKNRSRAFFSAVILPVCAFGTLSFLAKGSFAATGLMPTLLACLGCQAGIMIGTRLESRVNDALFSKIVLLVVVLAGASLLVQGMAKYAQG